MNITPDQIKAEGKQAGKLKRRALKEYLDDGITLVRGPMLSTHSCHDFLELSAKYHIESTEENLTAFYEGYVEGWNNESK